MTKHRRAEDWTDDILNAATDIIYEDGYEALTMASVAKRVALSKAGIYRFFSNRDEIALAVFVRGYQQLLDIKMDEIVGLGLKPKELFLYLLERNGWFHDKKFRRVWLQLLGKATLEGSFRSERQRMHKLLHQQLYLLAEHLLEGKPIQKWQKERLDLAMVILEGLTVQYATGANHEQVQAAGWRFIQDLVGEPGC